MKISKIIFAVATVSIFTLTSCGDRKSESTEEHGHEHDADGGHMHDETVEQEEFKVTEDSLEVTKDSLEVENETHKHDDGAEHHNH